MTYALLRDLGVSPETADATAPALDSLPCRARGVFLDLLDTREPMTEAVQAVASRHQVSERYIFAIIARVKVLVQ